MTAHRLPLSTLANSRIPPTRLILEAPHVFVEDVTVSSIAHAQILFNLTDLPRRLARYHVNAESLFWGWNYFWLDLSFRTWNIESFLDLIRCPVLVLQGAQDGHGTTKQLEAILARVHASSAIILENGEHGPHQDQPEFTLSAIRKFTRTLPSFAESRASRVNTTLAIGSVPSANFLPCQRHFSRLFVQVNRGEKSVKVKKVDSIFSTSFPFASDFSRTLFHSGSSWKDFQLAVAASRLGC